MSDTVLFTKENNDIANQSVDTSFFTSDKKSYDQSDGSSSSKTLFLSRCFLALKSRYVHNKNGSLFIDNLHLPFVDESLTKKKKQEKGGFRFDVLFSLLR